MNGFLFQIEVLKKIIARYALALLGVFGAFLFLTPEMFGWSGPDMAASLATNAFLLMKQALVPSNVPIVALGPVAPFVAPILVAFLLALLLTFPFALFLLGRFLAPALRPDERRTLFLFALPTLVLFYAGIAFAYFLIIPETFSVLYSFADPVGVVPMFALDQLLSSVFLLTTLTGVAFLLPVVMTMLGRIGFIPPVFWVRHWRGAVLATILFSAIVTPDGSGVTMMFLSGPIIGLYAIGTVSAAVSTSKRVI